MGHQDLRTTLTQAVHQAVDDLHLGAHVVVAVSGGADSVALLHLLIHARPDLVITVGHVRHGLREDAPDAAAARANAERLGVAFAERPVTVAAGEGPEDAARRARLEALAAIAELVGSDTVLLGHTADDQAETVLLRIARGTGIDGLAGMGGDTWRGGIRLLRPMLALRRADVRTVPPPGSWVEDPTNTDPDQRRARARHLVLPAIAGLRPDDGDVVPAICRLADLARRDSALLDQLVAVIPLQRYGRALLVPRRLDALPEVPALYARLLRAAWRLLPGNPPVPPAVLVERLVALPGGARMDAPHGVAVTASARGWALCPDGGRPLPTRLLGVGGTLDLPEHDLQLRCREGTAPASTAPPVVAEEPAAIPKGAGLRPHVLPLDPPPWTLHLPITSGPLQVGGRGPEGARDARRLLQDLVPAGLRHLVPLVFDDRHRILAVGSRPLTPAQPGQPCLIVEAAATGPDTAAVGYPAGP
ncbi:MAG TPA: tRNA lysidine(34) synthetase TilS [Euzebya sp.]|nr:tRNA lysidine(34) synthetase TilS [Euzebya sp.]